MKRLLLALYLLGPLMLVAQNNYEIYSFDGDVTLRRARETSWVKADALDAVSLDDVIAVGKGARVSIVEKSTGRLFLSKELGPLTVKQRLRNADGSSQSLFSALNKELLNSMRRQKADNNRYDSYAASANSVRGGVEDSIYTIYDTLYTNMLQCASGGQCTGCTSITLVVDTVSNNVFTASVRNNGEKNLFCNIVLVTESNASLCYFFDDLDFIPLPAGGLLDLSPFPLIRNMGTYVIVVSERDLSVEEIETAFEGRPLLHPCELKSVCTIKL